MNWDAIGAIAELVGAIAVVATLIYVGVQVRQNTLSNHNAALQTISTQYAEWLSLISENADVAHIFHKGQEDLAQLSEEERIRYGMLLTQLCRAVEAQYHQHQTKASPEEVWKSTLDSFLTVLSRPGGYEWWKKYGHRFSVSFCELISKELKMSSTPPDKSSGSGA